MEHVVSSFKSLDPRVYNITPHSKKEKMEPVPTVESLMVRKECNSHFRGKITYISIYVFMSYQMQVEQLDDKVQEERLAKEKE